MFCCFATYGQNGKNLKRKKSQYSVNLTFTPQLFLNSADIESDDIAPEAISTQNTGGYTIGTEIERRGKNGFILNAGFQYGVRHYSLDMGYENISFFLPEAAEQLNTLGPQIEHYSGSASYFKFRLMAGYVIPFKVMHNCHIEVKAGLSVRLWQTIFEGSYYRGITLVKNDSIFQSVIGDGSFRFGSTPSAQSFTYSAEWYIGLCKSVNTRFCKNINVGIEMTRAINFDKTYGNTGYANMDTYRLYDKYPTNPYSQDRLIAKDFSIGLKLSVGLWHK